ncbi:TNF receptor-associated factor 3-like [Montipora capricornis]|uniref:TNF receptor-associated factor 3-like n=1 Tax=Montipora capricornis TaxID=246305 RepID=UPI0035F13C32
MCVNNCRVADRTQFVDRLDDRLTCPICERAFNEPWQTSCGHRFCKNCLDGLEGPDIIRCPVDGEELQRDGFFRDKCCEREVLNLPCFCPYKGRGCEWRGELRYQKAHETSCQYGDAQCQACGETIQRKDLQEHASNACINRAVICPHCGGNVRQSNMKDHLEICPKFPISCIFNCGQEGIPRDTMNEHVITHCPNAEHSCPFSIHGCEFKGTSECLELHVKDSVEYHLKLLSDSSHEFVRKDKEMQQKISRLEREKNALEQQLQNQTEELVAARINIQTQHTKITLIEKSTSKQQRDMEELHQHLKGTRHGASGDVLSSQMEEIMKIVREHDTRVNKMQTELGVLKGKRSTPVDFVQTPNAASSHQACERRFERNEHQLALHDIQLSEQDLRTQMLEATSYDGVYLWKIDQYSRRYQDAVSGKTISIYSPPFYVGRFGYKVCARLYLNGDGMGKGTHLSVFFVIMRGEYDALLPWPFSQKVHFRLLDQDRVNDAFDAFRPDPRSSSFKRPTSDMNIASGCPTFISQAELRQGGYIRNDTMFIKITVDTVGLQGETWR